MNNYKTLSINIPKPLTQEEQLLCFQEMKNGNKEARNILIEHNLGLVIEKVKDFLFNICSIDELFSAGCVGLIKAVDSFNVERGFKFSTYAMICIQNEILICLKKEGKVKDFIDCDSPLLESETFKSTFNLSLYYEKKELLKIIGCILNNFPLMEKEVVSLYFGLYNYSPKTQCEIAKILNVSQTKVSRLLSKSLSRLRIHLNSMGFSNCGDAVFNNEKSLELVPVTKNH